MFRRKDQSKNLPESAIPITTYEALVDYARAFARGDFNLVVVIGGPGLGKSHCFRQAIGCSEGLIEGVASPLFIYELAYDYRNQPLVIDDVDGLYRDRNGIRLLKCLCQSESVKRVAWQTSSSYLEKKGIPNQFITSSPVAIIANQWKSLNADVSAFEDRGHFLHFQPIPWEVHQQTVNWFNDQEAFDFVADHLHLITRPSFRLYKQAKECKRAGFDWRDAILSRLLTGTAVVAAKLLADKSFGSQEERAKAFVASGAGCRATFFNYLKQLTPRNPVPRLLVKGQPDAPGPA